MELILSSKKDGKNATKLRSGGGESKVEKTGGNMEGNYPCPGGSCIGRACAYEGEERERVKKARGDSKKEGFKKGTANSNFCLTTTRVHTTAINQPE